MKHSLILMCAGLVLATSLHHSQADVPTPTPSPVPDVPDEGYRGGGDKVPGPTNTPRRKSTPRTPQVTGARVLNGHVRFTFGSNDGYDTMRFNFAWSRPDKAEATDMRWLPINQASSLQDYIINEPVVPDTLYAFKVQAVGRWKFKESDGVERYPVTEWARFWLKTPPPRIADRVQKTGKYSDQIEQNTKKPNPFAGKVDAQIQLIPQPILGKKFQIKEPRR